MLRNNDDFRQEMLNTFIGRENRNGYEAMVDIGKDNLLEIRKDGKTVAKSWGGFQEHRNWFKIGSFTYSCSSDLLGDFFGKTEDEADFNWIDEEEYLEAADRFLNSL